ncbi:50S ribosomal protein L40e [Candidatus Woesearchaeota archaeon]|nr:50S ribosomal protein L40e [Candidatus Woesearchaeota archaeon]
MAKFPEAEARWFKNVYVCKKCKTKRKAPPMKVLAGKIKCRKCNRHAFRSLRKK